VDAARVEGLSSAVRFGSPIPSAITEIIEKQTGYWCAPGFTLSRRTLEEKLHATENRLGDSDDGVADGGKRRGRNARVSTDLR
jgi:hypothetical protein